MSNKIKIKRVVREMELRERVESVRQSLRAAEKAKKAADDVEFRLIWDLVEAESRLEQEFGVVDA